MKSVVLFTCLFFIYNLYLVLVKPDVLMYQNQWQKNMAYAQNFLYESNATDIIVGSSMAARMNSEFLPKEFFNLAFSGGSVLTGLEILKKRDYLPKRIYVETNIVIVRDKDEEMIDKLFTPLWWQVKAYLPALREKYQPLNLLLSKIKGSYGKTHEEHMKDVQNKNIFESSIKRHIKNYAKHLNDKNVKMLKELTHLLGYFQSKGVEVVFFEIPTDERLAKSTQMNEQNKLLKEKYDYRWLKTPDYSKYTTADGIHLIYPSAYHFTKNFLKSEGF